MFFVSQTSLKFVFQIHYTKFYRQKFSKKSNAHPQKPKKFDDLYKLIDTINI